MSTLPGELLKVPPVVGVARSRVQVAGGLDGVGLPAAAVDATDPVLVAALGSCEERRAEELPAVNREPLLVAALFEEPSFPDPARHRGAAGL